MFSQLKRNPHQNFEVHKPAWKKTVEKSWMQVLIAVAILAIGILAFKYLTKADAPQVILNVLILRKGQLDVVKRSTLITQTDALVRDLGNRKVLSEWKALSSCVASGCSDASYFNFILQTTANEKVPNSDLILNLMSTYKYWNSEEDIVDFSKALTEVNSAVDNLASRDVTKAWGDIVKCNGRCEEINTLYFDMIKAVVLEGSVEE